MSFPAETSSFSSPEFLARIWAKDEAALTAVVQAYLKQILRAARGAGLDPSRAEDVTQATFLTFISTADRFEGRSHVRTWIFGILYNKIAEMRRQMQREAGTEDIDEIMEQRFDDAGRWASPPGHRTSRCTIRRSAPTSRAVWKTSPLRNAWRSSCAR